MISKGWRDCEVGSDSLSVSKKPAVTQINEFSGSAIQCCMYRQHHDIYP